MSNFRIEIYENVRDLLDTTALLLPFMLEVCKCMLQFVVIHYNSEYEFKNPLEFICLIILS